ncbi:hypothetical protein [Azospirillum halopraeferens]|uniref:hypothetical protein n=1 Tax=Azospirillum halopraeferens TaxID=34010 RepID=UPI000415287E|nr:hypothetical protein [Azospirillum halopraeferens]
MIGPSDNCGAASVAGAAADSTGLPDVDIELRARVWAILDDAWKRGEVPPSARAIRAMVNRNNSQVLRAVSAWYEERRAQHQATTEMSAPVAAKPTVPGAEPEADAVAGIPPAVAAVLDAAAEGLAGVAQVLVQVKLAMRQALVEVDERAERRLGETLAAANAAGEATRAAERERFGMERALLQGVLDARVAESARIVEEAAGMIEECEVREASALTRIFALEERVRAAEAEAAAHEACIDGLRKELTDTRSERDAARGQAATLAEQLASRSEVFTAAEARFERDEAECRHEIDRLRAEVEQWRGDLADAHRQIITLVAEANAAGALGAFIERLLVTMPISVGNVAAATGLRVNTTGTSADTAELDASDGTGGLATGRSTEVGLGGKDGAAAPACLEAGPVRRSRRPADVMQEQTGLSSGTDRGGTDLRADGTSGAASIDGRTNAANG